MSKVITIKGRLPGLNKIFGAANTNRYIGAKLKKEWTERIAWECKAQKVGKLKEPVKLEFTFYEPNRRRDPDNFTGGGRKLILDGMQMAGCLENDGWKNVKSFTDDWDVDKENPRVVIKLIEGGEEE